MFESKVLTSLAGFFNKLWWDNRKKKIDHDISVFKHFEKILNEDEVNYIISHAKEVYSIRDEHRYKVYAFLSEAEKESCKFMNKSLNKSLNCFMLSLDRFLGLFARHGHIFKNREATTVHFKLYDFYRPDYEEAEKEFKEVIEPRINLLIKELRASYAKFRSSVKNKLMV